MKGCKGALVSFSLRFTPHDIYYLALHFAICSNLLMLFILFQYVLRETLVMAITQEQRETKDWKVQM